MAVITETALPAVHNGALPHKDPLQSTELVNSSSSSQTGLDASAFKDWPNDTGFSAVREHREPKKLRTSGAFPSYVQGSLYRTGPGIHKITANNGKELKRSHWFDGFTYMHRFSIVPGDDTSSGPNVYYNSRCQVDALLEKARATGQLEGFTFGQKRDPCDSFWKKIKTTFEKREEMKPNEINIGVAFERLSGNTKQMTVTTDNSCTKQFDAETLEPMGVTSQKHLHRELKGPLSGTHAAFDPVTGDIYNYNLDFGRYATYRLFKIDAKTGHTDVLATISDKDVKPAYIHSMFITQSFVVLCVWPAYFKAAGASILWNQNLLDAMEFSPSSKCTWYVVDRVSNRGLVKKFVSPAMFCFHSINAWEEKIDDAHVDLFCELVQFEDTEILHRFYYENLLSTASAAKDWAAGAKPTTVPQLTRYKLGKVPSAAGSAAASKAEEAEIILQMPKTTAGELPTINPSYATKQHRYVYGVGDRGLSSFVDCIVKTDTREKTCLVWDHAKHTPGEPIFIANPEGTSEDDGVVLSVILDGEKGTSYLLCLDAADLSEVARAEVEDPIGFGFHGMHVAKAS